MKYLISTDLDGTLLDHHTYSWEAAKPGLALCRERSVPIILNTSKTLAEVDELARQLLLNAPMVVENGSALVLPKELKLGTNFKETARSKEPVIKLDDGREAVMFGTERATILSFIESVRRKHGWRFQGFNDWSIERIAMNTGLTTDAAQLAAKKQFSEPFVWNDSEQSWSDFIALAAQNKLKVLKGGRFFHLQGRTDKAKPLIWLLENISQVFGLENESLPKLICLGDNHNDVAMLNAADMPVCVKSPIADYPLLTTAQAVIKTAGEGPIGWNEAVLHILT